MDYQFDDMIQVLRETMRMFPDKRTGQNVQYEITAENVEKIVKAGRTRWKTENENNNTLKTKGYHLEHNYGHGKKHLSSLLVTMNLLAFLQHTILEMTSKWYQELREKLPTRKDFHDQVRAFLSMTVFDEWETLMFFMWRGHCKKKWTMEELGIKPPK